MEILNIIRIVIEIIMFAGIFTASIYVLVYLKKFNSSIDTINSKIEGIGNDIKPVLNDISILTGKINNISDKAVKISGDVENISGIVVRKTEEAEIYIDEIRDSVVNKARNILNIINAVTKGVGSFYKKLN